VFAHQDDELGALPRIRWEAVSGAAVWCCFLTDGARAVAAGVRDRESLATLRAAGVDPERIGFVGSPRRVADGRLAFETAFALEALRAWAAAIPRLRTVYGLEWEGGHHDHDAACVIAAAYAAERGVPAMTFPLYNGWRRPRGWFRVASFVPAPGRIERRRLTLAEAMLPVRAMFGYPSQRRTWLGLGPGLAVRALARRTESIREFDVRRLAAPPHPGTLLYEAMFGVSRASVMDATAALRDTLLRGR